MTSECPNEYVTQETCDLYFSLVFQRNYDLCQYSVSKAETAYWLHQSECI